MKLNHVRWFGPILLGIMVQGCSDMPEVSTTTTSPAQGSVADQPSEDNYEYGKGCRTMPNPEPADAKPSEGSGSKANPTKSGEGSENVAPSTSSKGN